MISLQKTFSHSLLFYFLTFFPSLIANSIPYSPSDFEAHFLDQLNHLRSIEKLPTLSIDPQLQLLSKEWSVHLAQEQKAFHRSSSSLLEFCKKESFSLLSENLHNSPQGNAPAYVLKRWMNSSVHRKNLLQSKITQMGISLTQGTDGVWYVVWNGGAKIP